MAENPEDEEYPESEIKIIVTDEEPGDVDATQNADDSIEEDMSQERVEQKESMETAEKEINPESEEKSETTEETNEDGVVINESDTLKPPDLGSRRKSTLVEMDKKHEWLSELEEQYRNVEETFISKFQYVAVSNHCQKYLDELMGSDESLIQHRIEFSILFDKFRTTFIGSQRLLNKISEINGKKNLVEAENRRIKLDMESKIRQTEELRENVMNLQNELQRAERERAAVQKLFSEVSDEKVDDSWEQEQASENKHITQDDEEAQVKINQLQEELELLDNELEFTKRRESMYQKKNQQSENEKSSLKKELNSAKFELQKQTTRAEKVEAAVLEASEELKMKIATIKTMTGDAKQMKTDLVKAKDESRRLYKDFKKCQKEIDSTAQVIEKLKKDIDIREDKIKMLITQKDSLSLDLSSKQAEIYALKGNLDTITKERNSLARRVAMLEERCTDAEKKLEASKKANAAQQKELDLIGKELEQSDGKTRELTKQKDALTEEVLKHEQTISELQLEAKAGQEKCRQLEKELDNSQKLANSLQENVKRFEKINERLTSEIAELNRNVFDLRGEIKRLEMNITEMRKVEANVIQQLADEQARYKLLAEDERHSRKLLSESKHEAEQLREHRIMLEKHIEQLKVQNQDLDERCKKLQVNIRNISEQFGNMKEAHKQEVKNGEELKVKLKRKDVQEQQVLKDKAESEKVALALRKKIRNLLEERNLQNSKLTDREKEISDLRENMRLLEKEKTTLDQTVNDSIKDIRLLKVQICQMSRSNALMNEQVEFVDATRQELMDIQNKLTQEKVKSKALESEVIRPVNLHRWRILEGIDPEKSQLVAKTQALQKQLIRRESELENKAVELKENKELAEKLKKQLGKGSQTSNIQEQLLTCQKELSARRERLKILTAENSMFENLCKKYENEIMALKNHLRDYKFKEFKQVKAPKKKTH